ncbi:acetyltransferase [Vibrio natriegens]|uniref:GNAT family N-acetyltransferase n=1 Tax=Vibrio natriegens TaxID=691 RepID=UPI0008046E3D|nr:GNAT family N-acetyltransferase [Vibrio natriegens]ANQ21855.1 acetyltransferase [Vibrio natriegens]
MEIITGNSSEIIQKAQAIRYQVFTVEQQIPRELDLDGLDEGSIHALVEDKDALVATARLTIKEGGSSVMARVAVTEPYRGMGIASKVVKALMDYARNEGVSFIEIHAHGYLRSYYEKFGFEFIREVEIVGEHQLIEMQYHIKTKA